MSVTRIRIAAVALALVVALSAAFVIVRASHNSPPDTANVPHWLAYHRLILAEAAKYERSHPGVSCTTDPPHNVYATQIKCTSGDGREFGLMILVAAASQSTLPDHTETQPLIGGTVDWGQILWYLIPSLTVGLLVVIPMLLARHFRPVPHKRRSAPQ